MLPFNSGKGGRGERYRVDCVGEYRELVTDHDEDVDIDMNVNGGYGCSMSFAIQLWEEDEARKPFGNKM
jgi:hypothetical protein